MSYWGFFNNNQEWDAICKGLVLTNSQKAIERQGGQKLNPMDDPTQYNIETRKWWYETDNEDDFKPPKPKSPIKVLIKDTKTEIAELQCVVCLDNKKCMTLNPCQHLCVCFGCSKKIGNCPVCRTDFDDTKHSYI
jgi:hypothetical protein